MGKFISLTTFTEIIETTNSVLVLLIALTVLYRFAAWFQDRRKERAKEANRKLRGSPLP